MFYLRPILPVWTGQVEVLAGHMERIPCIKTRREYIRVGSTAASLLLTVLFAGYSFLIVSNSVFRFATGESARGALIVVAQT